MLYFDQQVPDALILPEQITDLAAHLTDTAAHWLRASPDQVDMSSGTGLATWRSCTSDMTALRTVPHQKVPFDNFADGLIFREAQHCGYVVEDVLTDPATWSCAVRFEAEAAHARTLFTLNPDQAENYVFLIQSSGVITLKDQQNTVEIAVPVAISSAEPMLVIAGRSHGRLWLWVAGQSEVKRSKQAKIDLTGQLNLFVGCRSNKSGLTKTLGAFVLHDLLFWPNRNVLDGDHPQTLQAFDQPQIWGRET